MERGVQTSAQEGVDHQTTAAQLVLHEVEVSRLGHLSHLSTQTEKGGQIAQGVAFDLSFPGGQDDFTADAFLLEQAGDHEPVSAVVALAGDDQDWHGEDMGKGVEQGFGRASPGPLHQDVTRRAVLFDREPVQLTHLGGGDKVHTTAASPAPWERARGFRLRRAQPER